MILLNEILGSASDPAFADRLHSISHEGGLEYLEVTHRDAQRRRFRGKTDQGTLSNGDVLLLEPERAIVVRVDVQGTDCGLTLPRDIQLSNGDVLLLEPERAIVVRVDVEHWLRLLPRDAAAALRIGYHAGNLHWRVRFAGADLLIMLEGPREDYLARLQEFLLAREIEIGNDA